MKILKMSLITAVAVGSMASFATASDATQTMTGIEEALKDVKIDGFARYRFNDYDSKSNNNDKGFNHLDLDLKVHVPVGDNVMVTTGIGARGQYLASGDVDNFNNNEITIPDLYATYTLDKLQVQGGKMALGLPVTDNGYRGTRGVGLNASYNFGNVTILGAYFNGLDTLASSSEIVGASDDLQNDTSAVAVIGNWGMVDAQVWGMKVAGEIDHMIFADVGINHSGFFAKGQVINTKMNEDSDYMRNNVSATDDTGTFYAVKAGWDNSRYRVNAAYVSNDDKMAVHGIDHDVDTNVIHVGYRLMDDFGTQGGQEGMDAAGIGAGVTYGKFSLDGGYAKANDMKNAGNVTDPLAYGDAEEFWGKIGYAYNKKIDTSLGYSDISSNNDALDQKFLRFEVKYNF
jgi:hypothetical protein